MRRVYTWQDQSLFRIDRLFRIFIPNQVACRPNPASKLSSVKLTLSEKRHSAGLMRVNHSGEVCAQALYQGQALVARTQIVRQVMCQSMQEEADHLNWCSERVQQLGSHVSYLNLIWYYSSLVLGLGVGLLGDSYSLSFLAEVERQVTEHLTQHLKLLPESDTPSRYIILQMRLDESQHQSTAEKMDAKKVPGILQSLMQIGASWMTWSTYRI